MLKTSFTEHQTEHLNKLVSICCKDRKKISKEIKLTRIETNATVKADKFTYFCIQKPN